MGPYVQLIEHNILALMLSVLLIAYRSISPNFAAVDQMPVQPHSSNGPRGEGDTDG